MRAHVNIPKKPLMREMNRQCIEYEKAHEAEQVCRALWILHSHFGWGAKRLTEFFKAYHGEVAEMIQHYELDPTDDLWLCMKKLHDAGFSFEEDEDDSEGISKEL